MTRRAVITVLAIGVAINAAALALYLRPAHAGVCYTYDLGQWGTANLSGGADCAGPATKPSPAPCLVLHGMERGLVDGKVCTS